MLLRPRLPLLAGLIAAGLLLGALAAPSAGRPGGPAAQGPGRVTLAPVIRGDFPDPSVIRLGGAYWASATASAAYGVFPLMRSPDLRHWTRAGNVFAVLPRWAKGKYWAPQLTRAPDGQGVRVYYTAQRRSDERLCVGVATAPAPEGPYADHGPLVCGRLGAIDAAVSPDGLYLLWKADANAVGRRASIWARRLSADGLRLGGRAHRLLSADARWEGLVVEGPALVRRHGWLYLFYSGNTCCGKACDYAMGVARARSILGPWIKDPDNPILTDGPRWRCAGHGDVVLGPQGRWYLLHHAVSRRATTFERPTVLDRVRWTRSGWPRIVRGHHERE